MWPSMCICGIIISVDDGLLAQLARAPRLHRGGQGFESLATHHLCMGH